MKNILSISIVLVMMLAITSPVFAANASSTIPTFTIINVVKDSTVTIRTYNFPASDSFDVLMNYMGSRGVNGIKVATVNSGAGGSFTATFNIPAALKGRYQIAIRLQSNTGSRYYAYNWFFNNTAGSNGGGVPSIPGNAGYPTFSISSVVRNQTVTIHTYNLPPNEQFSVKMGPMGTKAINGIYISTINTGTGGQKNYTFNIPNALHGSYKIAIRMDSISGSGYYAYNWFFNNTTP